MLPPLVRHVIYPLHERLCGRRTFDYLGDLEESQHWSRGGIEALQMRKLKTLLQTADAHCPWHRQRIEAAGIELKGSTSLTLADLRRLPTMSKQDAISNGADMVWRGVPGGARQYTTGGSSGEPLIFHFGRRRQESDAAGRMRSRRWWGVDVGEREVYLWGAPVELNKSMLLRSARDRMVNHLVLNAFTMSAATMADYVEAIRRYRPSCIYGYASSLALLAGFIAERPRLSIPSLRVVCTTGEPLYPYQRKLIGNAFGVPVANEFGSRDIGFTAHESPAGQILLLSESLILDVLDPNGLPVDDGVAGEAVITGLCSEAQPFIRYRTGDVVVNARGACRDGRGLHVLGQVSGRKTDMIVAPDGTIMHALAIIYIFREIPAVREFKFVQHSRTEFEASVVPQPDWTETDRGRIVAGLRARLGDQAHCSINLVSDIPGEKSGKYRYVVSHVSLPDGLSLPD
jgi:phenylacetate-coenzyme A ligase PaaK-like adenylate-forming protein